jgi:formamidopyrimidine-DNA glycosylase
VPELLEVEHYRGLALQVVGREVGAVSVPDPHCLRPPLTPRALQRALSGVRVLAVRRRGKLLVLDTSGPSLGVRFGMTGGIGVDDQLALDRLLYSARSYLEVHVRLRVRFAERGDLVFHDPRRFGRVELDPDEEALGPDASAVDESGLRRALEARGRGDGPALKARLMDQARLAGLGNLLTDELLWRASLAPMRPAGALSPAERRRLLRHLRSMLKELDERGGSHAGDLMAERHEGGHCPRDGAVLRRERVGGRTTYWCAAHQG